MQGSQAEKCMEECPLVKGVYAWIHELRNRCKFPVPDFQPSSSSRTARGVLWCVVLVQEDHWKERRSEPGLQQENLDGLGEGPQPGTLEMCASGIDLLAEGAPVRALTNHSSLRAWAHIQSLQLPHAPGILSFYPCTSQVFHCPDLLSDGTEVTKLHCPLCTQMIQGRVSSSASLLSTVEQLGRKLCSLKARWPVLLLAGGT